MKELLAYVYGCKVMFSNISSSISFEVLWGCPCIGS